MGAPGPKGFLGWWGHLAAPKQKYIVQYQVSHAAQKPLKGALEAAIFNTFRRVRGQALFVLLPVSCYWYLWTSAQEYNHWLYTKDGAATLEKLNAEE